MTKICLIPYEEIVADLNLVTGRHYKHKISKTRELIKFRWKEGFRSEDFHYVHVVKFQEWGTDPYWRKFLRPDTLYGTKFEGYRNQPLVGSAPLDQLGDKGRETLMAGDRVLAKMEKEDEQAARDRQDSDSVQ